MIYLELFLCYLKIGFFGFGGGYSMLSLIHHEVVLQHGWISATTLNDIIAISQMTPGPIAINSATYIGYTVAGFWGSVVATISVCLPSLTIMVLITRFFLRLKDNIYMDRVMTSMRPAVIGMIGSASMLLIFPEQSEGASMIDIWSWIIFGAAFVASLRKADPIKLIALSALAGIAIYYAPTLFANEDNNTQSIEQATPRPVPWSRFDPANPEEIASYEFEQEWANYLFSLSTQDLRLSIRSMELSTALFAQNPDSHLELLDLGEKYLYNPNSPMRNDELFIPILESVIDSPQIDTLLKVRPTHLLRRAKLNRLGTIATDFEIAPAQSLHQVSSPLTILYFYDPECADCKRTSQLLESSQAVLAAEQSEIIEIVKMLVTDDHPVNTLYDLKAIPTLYLLDKDKRVVMKDAPVESIINFLATLTTH